MEISEDLSLGGPDTAIPALDGPAPTGENSGDQDFTALDTADQQEVTGAEGEQQEQAEPDAQAEAAVEDKDPLLAQFAKRTGLNPADPAQRKTLETLVNKEKFIQQLQGKVAAFEGKPGTKTAQPLTKFEQDLQQKEKQEQQQQQTQQKEGPKEPQLPVVGRYDDIGAKWSSPKDAYAAISEAWNKAAQTGDYTDVINTDAALFERRADAIVLPKVEQYVQFQLSKFMKDNFGAIMPQIQEQIQERAAADAVEFAYDQLEGTEGFDNIRTLDTEDESGQPLEVNGEKYRNTPLNKILAQNPWILHIKRENADPQVADRLTYLARLKAAHTIFSGSQISGQKAKDLVNAGAKQAQRQTQDRVRQTLNAGGTPSRQLDRGTGQKQKGYVQDLIDYTGNEERSFADL